MGRDRWNILADKRSTYAMELLKDELFKSLVAQKVELVGCKLHQTPTGHFEASQIGPFVSGVLSKSGAVSLEELAFLVLTPLARIADELKV